MYKFFSSIFLLTIVSTLLSVSNPPAMKIGRLRYSGGGDWYLSPTSLPNLIKFCNQNLGTNFAPEEETVDVGSKEIYNFPFIHWTGHGNVVFNGQEVKNLRQYLIAGGFLSINDSYGMDKFVRREMKKVFPELDFVELPFNHPIYHQKYEFKSGVPKIHAHDSKEPEAFGLVYQGRLVCFYNYECDLGDGWEDPRIHKDSEATRTKSLQMGANLVQYALTH